MKLIYFKELQRKDPSHFNIFFGLTNPILDANTELPVLDLIVRNKEEVPKAMKLLKLVLAAHELLESLEEASENCGCSIRERFSGHKTECPAPKWIQLIKEVKEE